MALNWGNIRKESIYLGEWKTGAKVSYLFDWMEPYAKLNYIYDVWTSDNESDRDEIEGIVGFNIFPCDNFTFSLEAANTFDREDIYATRITTNLRYEF